MNLEFLDALKHDAGPVELTSRLKFEWHSSSIPLKRRSIQQTDQHGDIMQENPMGRGKKQNWPSRWWNKSHRKASKLSKVSTFISGLPVFDSQSLEFH